LLVILLIINMLKRDIELYYSKVKKGGIFGGHDFSSASMGVVRAVIEYFGFDDLNVNT